MYQALYRKWRPRTFDDVVGQAHITETLRRQVASGRPSHAYLFTGTRGTGKTTCAKILARAVNCEHPENGNPCNCCPACLGIENGSILDVVELDAASNNGVDQIRTLRDEAIYTPSAVGKRVYIVDEVHMLSTAAFNALLKILEEPPAHLMFILATTELHKVPATIKSRCQQFAFKRITPRTIEDRLKTVAEAEQISLEPAAAALLARLADGGLRDALSLLDQCSGGGNTVTENTVLEVLGLAGNRKTALVLDCIARQDTAGALRELDTLYRDGKDMGAFLSELSTLIRDLLLRRTAPEGGSGLLTGGYEESAVRALLPVFTPAELLQMLTVLQTAQADLYRSSSRRLDTELCLIRLCDRRLSDTYEGLSARLSRLEELAERGVVVTAAPPAAVQETAPVRQEPPRRAEQPASAWEEVPPPAADAAPPWDDVPPPPVEDAPPWDDAPPPAENDAPPCDETPPPPVREAPAPAPERKPPQPAVRQPEPEAPAPAPKPAPASVSAPAPKPKAAPAPAGNFRWDSFLKTLTTISQAARSFLHNPTIVTGTFEENTVTIWTDSEMAKGVLSRPATLKKLEKGAETYTGAPKRIVFKVGKPAPAAPAATAAPAAQKADKFDELLKLGSQYPNITVTDE